MIVHPGHHKSWTILWYISSGNLIPLRGTGLFVGCFIMAISSGARGASSAWVVNFNNGNCNNNDFNNNNYVRAVR